MEIKGLRIIITGAASGFGKEMALQLSKQGANVAAIDCNEKALIELHNSNKNITIWNCNVADNLTVEKTIEDISLSMGTIDVLINNAGIMKNAPLINILSKTDKKHPIELWENIIAVNQNAVFYMSRSVVDKMITKRIKGLVLNVSSISAQGNSGQTAYSASKAAVEAMTVVWAKELGRWGIRSVAIAPGFINTAGTHKALEEKTLEQWIEKTPLRRTGTIEEIVKTVQFIIENDFINGVVINVNGGLTL